MNKEEWLLCPVCKNKTRTKLRQDTILTHYPLFCPKCRQETLVNVQQFKTTIIKEPDAKPQSQ
ncbi:MAG: cysteine-rich KTR domain-containing protein [Oscillospiraceae bacterium]|nr:cysteine-rich KTR domain-containing protein [Oscillospiraceae bacterium]